MARRKSSNDGSIPQISFTNWILGGPLITTNRNSTIERAVRASAAKAGRAAQLQKAENAEKKDEEKKDEEKPADKPAEEEKKPEGADEKPAEEKPTGDKTADNNGFTAEQDAKLLAMKAENKSWKMISMELGRSKNDVTKRFKELKEKEGGGGGSGGGENVSEEQKGDEKPSDADVKGKGKGKATEGNSSAKSSAKASVAGGEDAKAESPDIELKKLKPDNIWSTRDCEILEYLEARYESEKWLNMQANFYNHTGRMVVAELIEKKFQQDA